MEQLEEQDLLEKLKNASTKNEAFNTLVTLYQKRLYYHIRSILLNHEDSNDVLQETFIKIYQNISAFKGNSKLFSWMYRIATNQALDFLKKQERHQKINSAEVQDLRIEQLHADPYFDGDDIDLLLQKAINTLPPKQQLVFKMKYFQDLDYESLSEILDTSVGALKASYHLASKKIEEYLKHN